MTKYFAKKSILQINVAGFFKSSKKHCFESISVNQKWLQSFTKYLRLTHVKPMKLMFSCKIVHYEERLIAAFQEFFASIKKTFILAGGCALGYHSMGIRYFPDIS